MHKTKRLVGLCLLVLTTLALVAAPVTPAGAADPPPPAGVPAGSGSLEGTETLDDWNWSGQGLCIATPKTIYGLAGVGTYQGRTAGGQDVLYRAQLDNGSQTLYGDGPIKFEVESHGAYYYGPQGTHGTTDASCTPATAGTAIAADFRIFAADHVYRLDASNAQVPCKGTGTFARGVPNATGDDSKKWYAEWTLDEACTVVGNAAGTPGTGLAPANTAHTNSGVHEPCFSGSCSNNFRFDYRQYLPYEGLHVTMGGPDSATVGSAVAVTAAVTDDGAAVANAPVTFSVAGPVPSQPPAGAAVTGADGRTSFTFTSANAGDYTVTASVTSAGDTASGTHVVRFSVPPPTMALDGVTRWQTEDNQTVTATFTNAGQAIPATSVSFSVAGPGQATPASASALTDNNGKASFTFAANRSGDYTVTASASFNGQSASATHGVHLDIKSFSMAANLQAQPGGNRGAVMSPAGDFAYFVSASGVEKIDLSTFQVVGAFAGNQYASAVIDPAGRYAYFGSSSTSAGRVDKVDLTTMAGVGTIVLPAGEVVLASAVIDPTGAYAYFGTASISSGALGRVVKIDLGSFSRVGAITLDAGERGVQSAVMEPAGHYAYFGAQGDAGNPGRVVKIDLATFSRVGAVTLNGGIENHPASAVIDPMGGFAYFGTYNALGPDRVVKVDLNTFQRVGAVDLPPTEFGLRSAVIDPSGHSAYFGTSPSQQSQFNLASVVKVDLDTFERAYALTMPAGDFGNLVSAVIDPAGNFAYFKKSEVQSVPLAPPLSPAKVYKIAVSRPPAAWLVADNDIFSTPYASPLTVPAPGVLANDADTGDGDPLTAGQASDPAGGSVALNPDGSFTYTPDSGFSGTDTFTYTASDAMDYSAPATVTVTVAAPPDGVASVSGSAFGFYTNVGLFGGPQSVRGGPGSTCGQAGRPACGHGQSPSVSLPPSGADLSASDPDGGVGQYGPAFIFESHGPMAVGAEGTTGPDGSVTASASVAGISDNDPFHAHAPDGAVSSTCTATESGLVGSARVVNGRLVTSTDPVEGTPTSEVIFPHVYDPAPNTTYEGSLDHVNDRWRIVFNEQILGPDSITVNAVHMYLLGSTAIGDMVIGQSRCGVETLALNAAPAAADDAYVATAGRALTVPAAGVLANDSDADGHPLSATTLAGTPPPASGGGEWTFPSDPAHGTVSLGHDGSFTYTPDAGFTGTDSFPYLVQDSRGGTDQGTVTITVEPAPPTQPPLADFDGDGDTDVSVFRPSSGIWFAQGGQTTVWGTSGDLAVPADYDGDATTDVAVFRPSLGVWFLQASTAGESATAWGADGDVPVPADHDGDGRADLAVFRDGVWFVKGSTAGESAVFFGTAGDVPVPADYDGDGRADVAVFRDGIWFVKGSTAGESATFFGTTGDVPTPGDYDGDGRADIAVFRPSGGVWFVKASTAGESATAWGTSGDIPAPGDYDGDGRTDLAVFRPSSGVWFLQPGSATVWGTDGDHPLPLPAAIRHALPPG